MVSLLKNSWQWGKRGIVTKWQWFSARRRSAVKATLERCAEWSRLSASGVCLWLHTHAQRHAGMCWCVRSDVGRRRGLCGGVWLWGGGVVGLQQRQQEEHLRLSWHQVLLSCLNESNLPSPLLPSFTKQISFAVCSSLLIQLPQALCWVHQL